LPLTLRKRAKGERGRKGPGEPAPKAASRAPPPFGAAAVGFRIIAEGDSWFSHPLNPTVIDVLQQEGFAVRNLARAGDTLEEMILKAQYLPDLKTGSVRHFLFFGGGNDFLGNLEELVELFTGLHEDPENEDDVEYYVKNRFYL
jgi:hypothetical protein